MHDRLTNATIAPEEIDEVLLQARSLARAIQDIEFVMTDIEQRGLYSLIRQLEFATWDHPTGVGSTPTADDPVRQATGRRLRRLLDQVRESQGEPNDLQ